MRTGIALIIAFAFATASCSNSEFASSGAAKKSGPSKKKSDEPEDEPSTDQLGKEEEEPDAGNKDNPAEEAKDDPKADDDGDSADAPSDLSEQNGAISAPINYDACKALPSAGKRGYGNCNPSEVVVIVNDGKAQEMTCCPLKGKNIFSKKTEEHFVQRTGVCQANEVLTGMVDPIAPTVVCSKINTKYLELTAPVASTYVVGTAPGVMGQIAASYNVSDTCICPETTVAIGGHTGSDNQCAEQCVVIRKKK